MKSETGKKRCFNLSRWLKLGLLLEAFFCFFSAAILFLYGATSIGTTATTPAFEKTQKSSYQNTQCTTSSSIKSFMSVCDKLN